MTSERNTADHFNQALYLWNSNDFVSCFRHHWFTAEPTVAAFARACKGYLPNESLAQIFKVQETSDDALTTIFHKHASFFELPQQNQEKLAHQLTCVTKGLLHGVLAAHELSGWEPQSRASLPNPAIQALTSCLEYYHQAWNLYRLPVPAGRLYHGAAELPVDRASAILDQFGQQTFNSQSAPPYWKQSNWLLVRRLLSYLMDQDDTTTHGESNIMQMLLVTGNSWGDYTGLLSPVETTRHHEAWSTAYLDPVSLGVIALDDLMLDSLRVATRICQPLLQPLQSIRISPANPGFSSLSGDSAGGVVTLSTIATAQDHRLNRDWSASFTIKFGENHEKKIKAPNTPFTVFDVKFGHVGEDSVEAKLAAAAAKNLKTVLLHHTQPSGPEHARQKWDDWVPHIAQIHTGLTIRPIHDDQTLDNLIDLMTGDERIEQVLNRHARQAILEWDPALLDEKRHPDKSRAPAKPVPFVELHYARLLPDQQMEDSSEQAPREGGRGKDDLFDSMKYKPILTPDELKRVTDETETSFADLELIRLASFGLRICLAEDANAGKTIFSHRLRYFFVSQAGRQAFFGEQPPLVLRFENAPHRLRWPEDGKHLREEILKSLQPHCIAGTSAEDVLAYALERQRVVIILDAADQAGDSGKLRNFLNTDPAFQSGCRVIITGRSFVFRHGQAASEYPRDFYEFVTILGFNERQQARFFEDIDAPDGDFKKLFANYKEIKELLQVPGMLAMVREIALGKRANIQLQSLRTRGDFYWQFYRLVLADAAHKHGLKVSDHDELWQLMLAVTAFRMVLEGAVNYTVSGEALNRIREDVMTYGRVLGRQLTDKEWEGAWQDLQNFSVMADHSILEGALNDTVSFRHKGWLEFFFGLFLAKYADPAAVAALDLDRINPPQPKPSVPAFRGIRKRRFPASRYSTQAEADCAIFRAVMTQVTNADSWAWSWRFACEMPQVATDPPWHPERLAASLANLFLVPTVGPRPTELMYCAQVMFQQQPADKDLWDGILTEYRQQFLDIFQGDDLDKARLAAEVLWEDDLRRLADEGKTGKWSFEQLRPKHPAYVRCCDKDDPRYLTFLMGASDKDINAFDNEKPLQPAQTAAFYMATCCVTRAQYRLFDDQREKRHEEGDYGILKIAPDDDCPMIYVSWYDGFCFALWLGEKYRLPSEVEWEGAAWGGIDRNQHPERLYGVEYHGEITTNQVNFNGKRKWDDKKTYCDPLGRTLPVRWDEARKKSEKSNSTAAKLPHYEPNGFDLWHMNGNVWEWCGSQWIEELSAAIQHRNEGDDTSVQGRSVRGGSWFNYARDSRTSQRYGYVPESRSSSLGFRLSRTDF